MTQVDEISETATGEEAVYRRIWDAILHQRLAPGTKLTEEALCEAFATSRMRVRKALQRLAHEQIVDLVPNRGAFVARPGAAEAIDVIAVRRLLERHVIGVVAAQEPARRRASCNRLAEHVERERRAREAGDIGLQIRLSGEFHLVLAEASASPTLLKFMRELVLRNSLINAVFQSQSPTDCALNEHRDLVELIGAGDVEQAITCMDHHLLGKRDRLQLDRKQLESPDLRALLDIG